MIRSNTNLAKFLRAVHNRMTRKYDVFMVIDGGEGVGKSRGILLNVLDYWYRKILHKQVPKWSVNIDVKEWVDALHRTKTYDAAALDEAGDSMDSMDFANKFNKILYQVYTIIREKLCLSIVVLPSFFDLSPRFRKRRVRFLIHCYKRIDNRCKSCKKEFVGKECPKCGSKDFKNGFVCYEIYDRTRLNEILQRNMYKHIKKVRCGVAPLARGIVGEYKGKLADYYSELKTEKMGIALEKLKDAVSEIKGSKSCTHSWRYVRKTVSWYCRNCGLEVFDNPFEGGKES